MRKKTYILVTILVIIVLVAATTWVLWTELLPEETKTETIIDGAGREVVVPKSVSRVISLVTGVTGILYEINAGDKIVGVTKALPYPTQYYYPQCEDLPDVGGIAAINVEQVVGLAPDLVFTTEFFVSAAKPLEDRGITVVAIRLDTLKDITWNIRFIGSLVNMRAEAETLAQNMEAAMKMVEDRITEANLTERPRVYIESTTSGNSYGALVYATESVLKAGGNNIYGTSSITYPTPSYEYVIIQNPQAMLLFTASKDYDDFLQDAEDVIEDVKSRPGWMNIDAVKNNKICVIDNHYLNFGPDHPQSLLAMGKFFHPDLFADIAFPEYAYVPAG